jgi:hypothetical protein
MIVDDVKVALRVASTAYDSEISNLILSALADLNIAGVNTPADAETATPLLKTAIITYCKCNFGTRENYEQLKKSYDEQKSQLKTNSTYHDWTFGG